MANWWCLRVLNGIEAGTELVLRPDRTVIGRTEGDILCKNDSEISGIHAEIRFDASKGGFVLQDLKSRNGCKVNDQTVEVRALKAGDRIRLGCTEFVLEPPSLDETKVLGKGSNTQKAENSALPLKNKAKPSLAFGKHAIQGSRAKESFWARLSQLFIKPYLFFTWLENESSERWQRLGILLGTLLCTLNIGLGCYFKIDQIMIYAEKFTWLQNKYLLMSGIVLFATFCSFATLLALAVLFHFLAKITGGENTFKKAIHTVSYLLVLGALATLFLLVPKVGVLLFIPIYLLYLHGFAAASISVYHSSRKLTYLVLGLLVLGFGVTTVALNKIDVKSRIPASLSD